MLWGTPNEIAFTTAGDMRANDPVHLLYGGFHSDYFSWTATDTYCPYFPEFWSSKVTLILVNDVEGIIFPAEARARFINPVLKLAVILRHNRC
jgi:hypothetical protein